MARAAQAAEGADRRVWPELSVRPARPGASRMLVIAQLTFPETRKCDIIENYFSASIHHHLIHFQKCSFHELT